MPRCRGAFDRCQCHSTYTNFINKTEEQQNTTKNCLKIFTEKLNWFDADKTCQNEFSFLLHNNTGNLLFQELKNKNIKLVWTGIRKISEFYVTQSDKPSLYKESNRELSKRWAPDEPVHDCVALDIVSDHLVTHPCNTELEFICQNNGFPIYPVTETLICPEEWLFFYQLPVSRKKCIRPFIRSKNIDDAEETCLKSGSNIADLQDYFSLHIYMSTLNIADFGLPERENETCVTKKIQSVFGNSLRDNIKLFCTDTFFICEQDSKNLSLTVKVLPELLNSFTTKDTGGNLLTCDVSLDGKNINRIENQLHYMWFKNGIPVSVNNHLFQIGYYNDPTKISSSPIIWQGSYHCEVMVEGLQNVFISPKVNYFYSDISTYIFTLNGEAKQLKYQYFLKIGSRSFKTKLNGAMGSFKDLKQFSPNITWDFQKARLNGSNVTMQLLLFIQRDESSSTSLQNDFKSFQMLQKYFSEKKPESKLSSFSIMLQSADVCFEEIVPSSKTSYKDALIWKDTIQTKSAASEPMCLNGWRLITRECKPDISEGAKWLPFNYSICTKYQPAVKDLNVKCPEGFKELEPNLCYAIYNERYTSEEALSICLSQSSSVMDLNIVNSTKLINELEQTSYWISNTVGYKRFKASDEEPMPLRLKSFMIGVPEYNINQTFHYVTINHSKVPSYSSADFDDDEKLPFVCIHRPLQLLESIIFSRSWNKFPNQSSCYYVENALKTWEEATRSCQNLPVKSSLLQSIQDIEEYSLFKVLMYTLSPFLTAQSWWMNLMQEMDTLKWLNSPKESISFLDWKTDTDFHMSKSAGILTLNTQNKIQWSLRDLSSWEGFICERKDCLDNRSTLAYIEDRTISSLSTEDSTKVIANFNLHCIPSGWFIFNSISWFKDDEAILSESNSNKFSLTIEYPFEWEDIFVQGYYWCSVTQEIPIKEVISPKVLFKIPGLHTFVLSMKLKLPETSNCENLSSMDIPPISELNKLLHDILSDQFLPFLLKNTSCINSEVHYYIHFHVLKKFGKEEEIKEIIESEIRTNDNILQLLEKLQILDNDICIRSTVVCPKENTYSNGHSITWPETPIGQSTLPEELCVAAEGDTIERKCLGDFNIGGIWSPVENNCANFESDLTVNLHKLSKTMITEKNILNSSLNMETLTSTSHDLRPIDVQYVAQILRNIASVPTIEPKVLRSVVSTVDSVIDIKLSATNEKHFFSNASSKISAAVEDIISNVQTNGDSFKESGDNIAISVFPFHSNTSAIPTGGLLENWSSNVTTLFNDSDKKVYTNFGSFEAAVLLPDKLIAQKQYDNESNMAIIIHKNFHFRKDVEVISPVIDVSVGRATVYDVDPPLEMIFKIPELSVEVEKIISLECGFWDQKLNDNYGGWSYKGCYASFIDSGHMRCFCNHLTSFAVILELKPGSEIHKVHQATLSIITYIGCSLSLFGLGMIILTFILFRKWRKDAKHKVLFNLSLALACFLLLFLAGIERRGSRRGCMAVAVLLHYFMLASFAWMLVEAFMQYLSLVKVIGTYIPRFMQKAMLFAWGIPLSIVSIVLGVNYDLYNSKHKYCWLSDKVFFVAVAGPVLSMLALNFVIFGLILYSNTCGRSTKYLRTNQNERQEMVARAKAVFCVSVLLGLSWIFGFLAVAGAKLLFQYLFAITTTLQGFLIFIFFVFRQKSTRDLWLNCVRVSQSPDASHVSHITGGTDVGSRGVAYKAKLSYVSFNG
ncbi:adhesion G-protein coupled receptor G6 [Caerostris darwini]|uniref:Adhesion G-protein coupled receptor G6 n=1 Tax=Caerostris darwini TaxID=1538125 RepID=A0AAV4WE27_9ARAC|nr:adhesion G-protein coupled receptor G6 [Caerostris darwini]